jgi:hypothetical protein
MKIASRILYGLCSVLWLFNFIMYIVGGIMPNKFNIGLAFFMTSFSFFRFFIDTYQKN